MNKTLPIMNKPETPMKSSQPLQSHDIWPTSYIIKGVIACIGGLIFHLIIGALYQWGIINIYVTSYYKLSDPSVTLESNAIAFPLMQLSIGLTMRLGIYLADLTHPIIVQIASVLLASASVFIASEMTAMWPFLFFQGILFGLVVGLGFMVPVVQCNKYFPGKVNYVNGVILAGTGLGSVVFGNFSYKILNPDELRPLQGYYLGTPDLEDIAAQVPRLFKLLSLLYLCMGICSVLMLSPVYLSNRRKQNQKTEQLKSRRQQNQAHNIIAVPSDSARNIHDDHQAHSIKEACCSWICWIQICIVFLVACGLYMLNGNFKTYVKKTIDDDKFLTMIGTIGSIGNGLSRFLWNLMFLKTGYKTVILTIISISIVIYSTIRFTVTIKQVYLIEIFLANCCIGGLLVTTPTVVQAIYGQKTGSNIYGFYWQVIGTSNFLQYIYVSNVSKSIGFDNTIYICLAMTALAIPIILYSKFQGPWHNKTDVLEYCVGYEVHKSQEHIDMTLEHFQEHLSQENKRKNPQTRLNPQSSQFLESISEKKQTNGGNEQKRKIQSREGQKEGKQQKGNQEQRKKQKQMPKNQQPNNKKPQKLQPLNKQKLSNHSFIKLSNSQLHIKAHQNQQETEDGKN